MWLISNWQAETNKLCNYLSPELNNDQVIVVYHHIHCLMLKYVETLPCSDWLLIWKSLIKFSFPTLPRLGFPIVPKDTAKHYLDLFAFSMENHGIYQEAWGYPPEKHEIDGTAPEFEPADLDEQSSQL